MGSTTPTQMPALVFRKVSIRFIIASISVEQGPAWSLMLMQRTLPRSTPTLLQSSWLASSFIALANY
jgi:hypothetical protein